MANKDKIFQENIEFHQGLYELIKENIKDIPDGSIILTTDKNLPIPSINDEGKGIYVDSFGRYVLRDQPPSQNYTYDTYEQFLTSIEYEQLSDRARLKGLVDENGNYVTADFLKIGADIYFRQVEVPDLWLSRKIVEGQIQDGSAFFAELETKGSGSGVLIVSGENLETTEYAEGQLYYCTSSSDSFSANTLYCGKSGGIMKITSTNVSIDPDILSFSAVSGTYEIGSVITTIPYSYSLKKSNQFATLDFIYNSNIIHTLSNFTNTSGSFNYTINNTSVGTKTIQLKGTLKDGKTKSRNASYYVYARQYYGDSEYTDVMTSEIANNVYPNITESDQWINTFLQGSLPTSINLNYEDNYYNYVWFLIPTNLTINTLKSGGFDFPFIQQDNITMTNKLGAEVSYKVYRSANMVTGEITIDINK